MILREFKVWGGKREENDSLYIWAKDADDAIGIARLTDQSICISQWTGNEKSYEEAITILKDCELNPCVSKDKEAAEMAITALEKQDRIAQILDDYDLLDTWEVLEMIKEVMKEVSV